MPFENLKTTAFTSFGEFGGPSSVYSLCQLNSQDRTHFIVATKKHLLWAFGVGGDRLDKKKLLFGSAAKYEEITAVDASSTGNLAVATVRTDISATSSSEVLSSTSNGTSSAPSTASSASPSVTSQEASSSNTSVPASSLPSRAKLKFYANAQLDDKSVCAWESSQRRDSQGTQDTFDIDYTPYQVSHVGNTFVVCGDDNDFHCYQHAPTRRKYQRFHAVPLEVILPGLVSIKESLTSPPMSIASTGTEGRTVQLQGDERAYVAVTCQDGTLLISRGKLLSRTSLQSSSSSIKTQPPKIIRLNGTLPTSTFLSEWKNSYGIKFAGSCPVFGPGRSALAVAGADGYCAILDAKLYTENQNNNEEIKDKGENWNTEAISFVDKFGTVQNLDGITDYDSVTCMRSIDIDWDGVPELVVGTYSGDLNVYKCQRDGAGTCTADSERLGKKKWKRKHSSSYMTLNSKQNLCAPIVAFGAGDVLGENADSLAVCTMRGLHIMRPPIEVAVKKISASVKLMEELNELRTEIAGILKEQKLRCDSNRELVRQRIQEGKLH
eukprot:g5787.t1